MKYEITEASEGSSDHNPVLLALGEKGNQQEASYRTTDWEKYKAILIEHRQNIEDLILALENAINAAIEASTTT